MVLEPRPTPPHHEHIKGSRPSQLRAAAKREEHLLLLANQEEVPAAVAEQRLRGCGSL